MKQKRMRKKQMLICLGVMLLLSAFTFHMLLKTHSPKELLQSFSGADLRFVIPGFLCMLIFVNCEAANIRSLMRTFQKKIPFKRSLSYAFANFYFSAITPSASGGQPMQLYYMSRDGFGFAQSSFTLLAVSAVYQITIMGYGTIMVLSRLSYVQSQSSLIKLLLVFGILVNGICSGGILLVILRRSFVERITMGMIHILGKLHIVKNMTRMEIKIEHLIEEYSRGGDYLKKYPRVLMKMVFLAVTQLTALFLIPYFACMAMGITAAGIGDFLAIQAILSLAVTAVPLPGSVGASEGTFLLLYAGILPAGTAFSAMLLSRAISFYGFLLLSGVITVILQFSKKAAKLSSG